MNTKVGEFNTSIELLLTFCNRQHCAGFHSRLGAHGPCWRTVYTGPNSECYFSIENECWSHTANEIIAIQSVRGSADLYQCIPRLV